MGSRDRYPASGMKYATRSAMEAKFGSCVTGYQREDGELQKFVRYDGFGEEGGVHRSPTQSES